jgi:hypothetical protein
LNLYLAKTQAFNQTLVNYNALQVQLLNLNAVIAQANAEYDSIKDQISNSQDPTLPVFKAFMAKTYGEVLDRIIRDVYGLCQAYRYWALADYSLPPSDGNWDMAYLSDVQSDVSGNILAEINDYGSGQAGPTQPFDYRVPGAPVWTINDQEQLAAFKTDNSLDFTILPESGWAKTSFDGMAQVVASDFVIEIAGAKTSDGDLIATFTHSGIAPFIDKAGKRWQFSHYPVLTSYKYVLDGGQPLAGGSLAGADGVEIGLSPFTTWRIAASPADNPGLDLSGVTAINIRFAGRYRS